MNMSVDGTLVRYEKRLLTWYVGMLQKTHPKNMNAFNLTDK